LASSLLAFTAAWTAGLVGPEWIEKAKLGFFGDLLLLMITYASLFARQAYLVVQLQKLRLLFWLSLIAGFAAGLFGVIAGLRFILGRSMVELVNGKLVATERLGPFRWIDSRPMDQVQRFVVLRTPRKRRWRRSHAQLATIVAQGGSIKPMHLVSGYPAVWLHPFADELARRWEVAGAGESAASRRPTVEVAEAIDAPDLDLGDTTERPSESRVHVQFQANWVTLHVPPLGRRSRALLLMIAIFFFWSIFLGGWLLGVALYGEGVVFWFLVPILSLFELLIICLLYNAIEWAKTRTIFQVVGDKLLITEEGPFRRTQQEWNRNEIALVGVGRNGSFLQLRIHPRHAREFALLTGRDRDELRWIATTLRGALNLR
jgi:hypothetical protein